MAFVRLESAHADPVPRAAWGTEPTRAQLSLRCESSTLHTTLRDERGFLHGEWDEPRAALTWAEQWIRKCKKWDLRWVGYLSYDAGRLFEQLPSRAADDLGLPLFHFTLHNRSGTADRHPPEHHLSDAPLSSNFSRPAYESAVARCLEYIRAGDVFQVNLSQRFTAGLPVQPWQLFNRLRMVAPAHYAACLDYGDYALVCNSPELFLRVTPDPATGKRRVVTRPIKGTRPRTPGAAADLAAELRDSAKDQAELNMIVDLERNDLGRVCEIGSVRVTEPRSIEAHPTVYHGVATVDGLLRDDVGFVDLLRATFPGGSVTGAPKIRSMQIIEELEGVRRGPYCGAIGYLSADGSMQFNIAIRTMIVKNGAVHIPVGGGIVADSDPAAEYEETLFKAWAMFAALGIQRGGRGNAEG